MGKNLYSQKIKVVSQILTLLVAFVLISVSTARGQATITIKGKVTDAETKEAIPEATVAVKGTTNGVHTDLNGDYSIIVGPKATLVFSFLGYTKQEIPVLANQTVINVKLQASQEQLRDVVVTALNIPKEERSIGYSETQIKGATLTEARENSFMNGLEGEVAGVNVSPVATGPNGATNVVIRGITSLTGSSQPLYVLNGIPMVNNNYNTTDVVGGYGGKDGGDGIGDINPDDIATISILKGAAATALYGYRGANGVVLITTKRGTGGDGVGIEFNSNFVWEQVIDNTNFQTEYGQGYNGVKPVSGADALGSMESSWGAPLDGSEVYQFDGVKRPYAEAAKGNLARFYQTGGNATNTVAFSKDFGDDNATRFSFSDLNDNSYVPNAGLQRMTFTQTTNLKLDKHFTLDLSSEYVSEYTKNAPNVSDAPGNLNWGAMFVPPNVNITTLAGPRGNGTLANGYEENPFSDVYSTNPYFSAYEFQGAIHRNRFIGSADLKYTFDNGIYINFQVADDYTNDRNTNVTPTGTAYEIGGDMTEQNVKQTELNLDLTTGKKFAFTKDFSLNVLLGVNYRNSVQEYVTASGQTFATPFLYNIQNLITQTEFYSLNHEEFQSFYASGDLAYKSYLYLTITGRSDWYSTLAPGQINYTYPSVSGSFVFSELLHIPNMDIGKLRLSYATVGGEAGTPYGTLQSYNIQGSLVVSNGTYPIGQAGTTTVPNPELVPSKRQEYEVGTEMTFFKDRLRIDVAAYQKKVIDDIVPVTIDIASGYNSALLNVGDLRDDGIELALGGTPYKTSKFSWDVDFNGTYNISKVLSLGGQPEIALGSAAPDWGSIATIEQVVGLPSQQIIALSPATNSKGQYIIDPVTATPDASASQPKDFGSAIDPWTGGITNKFKFGAFNLSFLIDGKFGGKVFSNTNFVAYVQGLSKQTLPGRDLSYGTEGDNAATYYGNLANAEQGLFVYNASFLKFRQIIFGYDIPAKVLHNKLHGVRVSFVCRNVFTILKYTPNIDPEASYSASVYSQGLESAEVPYSRTFGLNLNVKL